MSFLPGADACTSASVVLSVPRVCAHSKVPEMHSKGFVWMQMQVEADNEKASGRRNKKSDRLRVLEAQIMSQTTKMRETEMDKDQVEIKLNQKEEESRIKGRKISDLIFKINQVEEEGARLTEELQDTRAQLAKALKELERVTKALDEATANPALARSFSSRPSNAFNQSPTTGEQDAEGAQAQTLRESAQGEKSVVKDESASGAEVMSILSEKSETDKEESPVHTGEALLAQSVGPQESDEANNAGAMEQSPRT